MSAHTCPTMGKVRSAEMLTESSGRNELAKVICQSCRNGGGPAVVKSPAREFPAARLDEGAVARKIDQCYGPVSSVTIEAETIEAQRQLMVVGEPLVIPGGGGRGSEKLGCLALRHGHVPMVDEEESINKCKKPSTKYI